jgi:hypothetical protein
MIDGFIFPSTRSYHDLLTNVGNVCHKTRSTIRKAVLQARYVWATNVMVVFSCCFLTLHDPSVVQPQQYPTFDSNPHPVPFNLYDPFGLARFMSDETKERRLRVEINNGRLAQVAIIAFLCEQKLPGSVPLLQGIVEPYGGDVMAPFEANFRLF